MFADAAASNEFERVEYFLEADGHWSGCQTCLRRSRRPFGSTDRYVRGDVEAIVEAADNRGRQSALFRISAMCLRLSTISCTARAGTACRGRERTRALLFPADMTQPALTPGPESGWISEARKAAPGACRRWNDGSVCAARTAARFMER
jgi:hypothetical protein